MSVKLEVFFVDLIGYVFQDLNLWALMPKAEGHLPMLVHFSANNPKGDLDLGHGLQAVFPRNRSIVLDPPGGTGVEVPRVDPFGEFPLASGESFKWVTKLDALVDEDLATCSLDPEVLGPNPKTISSRFLLEGGKIRSERFVVDRLGSVNMGAYRFRNGANLSRAMVNVTKLERDLETPSVTLRLQPFSGGAPSEIVLHPEQDGKVSFVYMNLATTKAAPGSHYHLFAKLLACKGRPPGDDDLIPTARNSKRTVNPPFTGILADLKTALEDPKVLEALAQESKPVAVFVNPETCPQGRYN